MRLNQAFGKSAVFYCPGAACVQQAGLVVSALQKRVLSCCNGISKGLQPSSEQVGHVQHSEGFLLRKEASWPSAPSIMLGSSLCHTSILTSRGKLGLLNFGVLSQTSQPSFTSLLYLDLYIFLNKIPQKIKQIWQQKKNKWKNLPKVICIWKKFLICLDTSVALEAKHSLAALGPCSYMCWGPDCIICGA